MSMTTSVGVVGPAHWAYMSGVLARRLNTIIDSRHVDPKIIPQGVLIDAVEFFHLVTEAIGDTPPENPPASLNAYVIAADTIRGAQTNIENDSEIQDHLQKFSNFVNGLKVSRAVSEEELELVKQLRDFLEQLGSKGESENYERTIYHETAVVA